MRTSRPHYGVFRNGCNRLGDHRTDIPFRGDLRIISGMENWRQRARERMKSLGITQDALSERLEMTQGGIQHWLAGSRQPALEDIDRIAKILGVPGAHLTHGVTPDDLCTDLAEPARTQIRRLIKGARSGAFDALFFQRLAGVIDLAEPARRATPSDSQPARPTAEGAVVFEQVAREAESAHVGVRVPARKRR